MKKTNLEQMRKHLRTLQKMQMEQISTNKRVQLEIHPVFYNDGLTIWVYVYYDKQSTHFSLNQRCDTGDAIITKIADFIKYKENEKAA